MCAAVYQRWRVQLPLMLNFLTKAKKAKFNEFDRSYARLWDLYFKERGRGFQLKKSVQKAFDMKMLGTPTEKKTTPGVVRVQPPSLPLFSTHHDHFFQEDSRTQVGAWSCGTKPHCCPQAAGCVLCLQMQTPGGQGSTAGAGHHGKGDW